MACGKLDLPTAEHNGRCCNRTHCRQRRCDSENGTMSALSLDFSSVPLQPGSVPIRRAHLFLLCGAACYPRAGRRPAVLYLRATRASLCVLYWLPCIRNVSHDADLDVYAESL